MARTRPTETHVSAITRMQPLPAPQTQLQSHDAGAQHNQVGNGNIRSDGCPARGQLHTTLSAYDDAHGNPSSGAVAGPYGR